MSAIEMTSGIVFALRIGSMLLEGIDASPIMPNASEASRSVHSSAGRSSDNADAEIWVTGVLLFLRRSATSGGGTAVPPARTSASEFAAMIVSARIAPVGTIIHGCWKMNREAVWIMPPHVGSGGCGPSPMKASAGLEPDADAEQQHELHDDSRRHVRQDVADAGGHRPHAVDGRGLDEQLLVQRLRLSEEALCTSHRRGAVRKRP